MDCAQKKNSPKVKVVNVITNTTYDFASVELAVKYRDQVNKVHGDNRCKVFVECDNGWQEVLF